MSGAKFHTCAGCGRMNFWGQDCTCGHHVCHASWTASDTTQRLQPSFCAVCGREIKEPTS